jgi:FkbM family methyltransferase
MFGSDELSLISYFIKNAYISKSQLFQDLMVLHELGGRRDGFFVEFGACDGIHLSNTFSLEKHFGWTGVVAEPGPIWHSSLFRNRSCFISTKCVSSETGEIVVFNETPDAGLSTMDRYTAVDWHAAERADGKRISVETITLRDLLIRANAPRHIDYLSVDTEGSEFDILESFNFEEYDIDVITVEHNHTSAREAIYDLLASKGFRRKYMDLSDFDDWYVREARSVRR